MSSFSLSMDFAVHTAWSTSPVNCGYLGELVVCTKPCLVVNSWKKSALYWDPLTDFQVWNAVDCKDFLEYLNNSYGSFISKFLNFKPYCHRQKGRLSLWTPTDQFHSHWWDGKEAETSGSLGAGWFLAQLTHWATSYPLFALRALALGDSQVTGDRVNVFKDL